MVGLVSLLLRSRLDPHLEDPKAHFVVFGLIGIAVCSLAYSAGEAANRRGDARILLLSLAFMTTGIFLELHALGTPGILFSHDLAGFKVAIPIGLLVGAIFAAASAFVDVRPEVAELVMRRRKLLRMGLLIVAVAWFAWTVAKIPPLHGQDSEGATGSLLTVLAIAGAVIYAVCAARYWRLFRRQVSLLPGATIACFVLLSEALIGVAVTGERDWHASWWEWHGLIVTAYMIVVFAARREWRDERFRELYLTATRERHQDVSVLFSDLVGFTSFSERKPPADAAEVLSAYSAVAARLITRRFSGELEKFIGDGIMASFNSRGDQPDHALQATRAAQALQSTWSGIVEQHPDWPRMRIGVNTGEALVHEIGGEGHVTYALIGDAINTGSRLEGQAPAGEVLLGAETYQQLPTGTLAEPRRGLVLKGKNNPVDAYLLQTLPKDRPHPAP
jgi:class 3 adenylate cyclase